MSGTEKLTAAENQLEKAAESVIKLIGKITDEQSFVECDRFIYSDSSLGACVGEGVVSGFASVNGENVALFATNPAVLKGSIGRRGAEKIAKTVNNAVKTGSPVIGIFDTSGARFSEGIEALEGYGKIIKAFSDAYGAVPLICIIKGNNFGLSSYLTSICDVCIAYDKSSLATASPLILAAKADKDIKTVGTAAAHSKSGVYSLTVKSDAELKSAVFNILGLIDDPVLEPSDDPNRVAASLTCGVKAAALINEVFDQGTFIELKKDFGASAITGLARLNGMSVGVVASNADIDNGRLGADACVKISSLLSLCLSHNIPVINLVNSKGSAVSLAEENGALIRETADMMFLYNQMPQAKIALIYGEAIGSAYVALAGKSTVDYSLAWPCANIGAVDGAAAAELLYSDQIAAAENKEAAAEDFAQSYCEENTNALTVSKFGYIDNVIEPALTRQYLISAVQIFLSKE